MKQLVNLWKYSGSAVPEFLLYVPARVKIAVSVSTDLEDDVIFFIKDF